jgi:hypothetical protein
MEQNRPNATDILGMRTWLAAFARLRCYLRNKKSLPIKYDSIGTEYADICRDLMIAREEHKPADKIMKSLQEFCAKHHLEMSKFDPDCKEAMAFGTSEDAFDMPYWQEEFRYPDKRL